MDEMFVIERKEIARVAAMEGSDAREFYRSSLDLGLDAESSGNPGLFMEGASWVKYDFAEKRKQIGPNAKYHELARLTREQGLRVNDIGADINEKRVVLLTVFPRRFGENGKQPISRYDGEHAKLGSLYRGIYREALRKIKER